MAPEVLEQPDGRVAAALDGPRGRAAVEGEVDRRLEQAHALLQARGRRPLGVARANVQVEGVGRDERFEHLLVAAELKVGRLRTRKVGREHLECGDVYVDTECHLQTGIDGAKARAASAASNVDKLHGVTDACHYFVCE